MIARTLFVMALASAPFVASANRATAAERNGAPDLAELKEAIATADKKGENVGAIREALTAFEKALVRSAAKPGEAPPELTALREAVEMAARKGENVAAVSKELGHIEKALTGREYERPKPPPPPELEPVPTLPRRGFGGGGGGFGPGGFGGRPGMGGGRIVIEGGKGKFNATSVTITNNSFTIKARLGDVSYAITGSLNGPEAPKIVIQEGEKKIETEDLKKVPEEYRPAVEQLLKMVR